MEKTDLPLNKDITYMGLASYRDRNQLFGIKRKDRRQHVYILGKSGTGKSVLMFNMIIQNIKNGEGVCVVDPHGELVEGVLSAIPKERLKDVVYFNPADTDYHIGFNVLELIDPQYKHLVASGLMGIFTKIWANAWSARMEYILNNAILALLDTPGTTLLGIPRMLVDKDYRQKIISNLKDPVIKAFWVHEYEGWQEKFRNEAIAPIQNKVGQFLSTSIIRNVVGQSKSTIDIFQIMNTGKIFLVNVSKGRIGEDNSALLGGMLITKIQLAAMERVRIPEDERKDFYLYVDEFQNFVTDSFAGILSEARKYRLNLTVAHQYTAQLVSDKSSAVRDAVFGNVGTMVIFRCGADDASFLEKEFEPEFTPQDIVNLPNYKVYLKLMIDGITSRPFSAKTLPPLTKGDSGETERQVINTSRELYCRKREDVEREINDWSGMSLGDDSSNGNGEKFKAICSSCGKETFVPFKPEPGRPVYCKDCIAKIKSGEIKPVKGTMHQIRHDEAKYFKPLSDLGIEFQKKDDKAKEGEDRYQEDRSTTIHHKPGVFSAIKKVFTKNNTPHKFSKPQPPRREENTALRDILNKTLNENKILDTKKEVPKAEDVKKDVPPAISLNELKEPKKVAPVSSTLKDRSASKDDMNKLKNFIHEKMEKEPTRPVQPVQSAPVSVPTPTPIPAPVPIQESKPTFAEVKLSEEIKDALPMKKPEPTSIPKQEVPIAPSPDPTQTSTPAPLPPTQEDPKPVPPKTPENKGPKEVPEDVLRKILE